MKKSDLKKFLLKLAYLIPIVIIMVLVNLKADPANVFGPAHYEKDLARYLADGRNVENVSNYNERLMQKFYVETIKRKPDVLVIGSSRAMQISSDLFPGKQFFNASVSNAVVQDYVTIYEIYRKHGYTPSTLILGLDPWVLNSNHGITRWKELEDDYLDAMDRISGKKHFRLFKRSLIAQKYLMLLNPKYFQRSLRVIFQPEEKMKHKVTPTDAVEGEFPIKMSDGSYVYERAFREQTIDEVRASAVRIEEETRLSGFTSLDKSSQNIFESFIDSVQKDNVEIIFFLTPYHPAYYERILKNQNLKIILDVETYFRTLASEKNIKIIGSYDPSICGLIELDFYDRAHPKREAIDKIFHN